MKFSMTDEQIYRMNDLRLTLAVAEKEIQRDVTLLNMTIRDLVSRIQKGSLKRHHELTEKAYALRDEVYLKMGLVLNMGFYDAMLDECDPAELEMVGDGFLAVDLDLGRSVLDDMEHDVLRYSDPVPPPAPPNPTQPTFKRPTLTDDHPPYLPLVHDPDDFF